MRVALRLGAAVVGDVDLAADDGLDPVLLGRLDEVDRAGEGAVIGERDGGHLELCGAGCEGRNAARTVEDRVLRVDVKVDERSGLGHGSATLQGGPDGVFCPRRDGRSRAGGCRSCRCGRPRGALVAGEDGTGNGRSVLLEERACRSMLAQYPLMPRAARQRVATHNPSSSTRPAKDTSPAGLKSG